MNTDPGAMRQRTGEPVALGRARLPGWRFRFAYHADVVQDPDSVVDGVLWDISQDHLQALDRREGYPVYYGRRTVTVEHQGKLVEAIVYYMQNGEPLSLPSEGYLSMLHSGYSAFSVPKDQIHRALDEVLRAGDLRHEYFIKYDRDQRANARWLDTNPSYAYDAGVSVSSLDTIVDEKTSKFYGRDVYSLTDSEWREYELELIQQ